MGGGGTSGSRATEGLGTSLAKSLQSTYNEGPNVFDKSLYAGMSDTTKSGIDQTVSAANAGQGGLNAAQAWNTGLLNSGGLTGDQKSAMSTVGGLSDTYGNIANGLSGPSAAETGYTGLYNNAGNPSLTEQQLMGVATGQAFGEEAPGYATVRQNALDDALGGVGSSFLTNGRFGSSVMGDAAGKAATGVLANLDYTNYQNDIARQQQALSAIEGQRQQGFQNQFNSLGAADQSRLNQYTAQMGALGAQGNAAASQFNMGQQGTANSAAAAAAAPGLFQSTLLPGQAITAAGQLKDADAQAQRLGEADLFDRTKNAQTNFDAQYLSMLQGLKDQPGTQQQTPWWQSLISLGGQFL